MGTGCPCTKTRPNIIQQGWIKVCCCVCERRNQYIYFYRSCHVWPLKNSTCTSSVHTHGVVVVDMYHLYNLRDVLYNTVQKSGEKCCLQSSTCHTCMYMYVHTCGTPVVCVLVQYRYIHVHTLVHTCSHKNVIQHTYIHTWHVLHTCIHECM